MILAARDALLTISPAAGYRLRPRVQIGPGPQPPAPLAAPTVLVHDADGSQAMRIIHQPPIWEHTIRFAADCWVPGAGGEDGRERELFNLTADVRRCLLRRQRTLDGLVRRIDEIEPDGTDEAVARPTGWARLEFAAVATIQEEE